MAGKTTQEVAAAYALRMILAMAEDDMAEFRRIDDEIGRSRNKKLPASVIVALTGAAASAFKSAYPQTWNAELRMNLHDLDMDPARWTTDQPGNERKG
ncbi:hypothetical protein [Pseudarthrobacter sp. NS4]|uniref:hypothetical protein n=1 Tax=Pseudarthrobacter sp. NS4 TaxID=2973976 RepID=UPI00216387CD|nr:hypothetical protein [Pseudarthrobacter sp. NS4]